MIRFSVRNPEIFFRLRKTPVIRYFTGFRMSCYREEIPAEIRSEIFASFYVADGTSRQTRPMRFQELDPVTVALLRQEAPPGPLHDVAVADGSTSLCLLRHLRERGIDRQLFISDKYSQVTIDRGVPERILDRNGDLLAIYPGCFIGDKSPMAFFVSRLLFNFYKKKLPQRNNSHSIAIKLWAPDVQLALSRSEMFELTQDVFSPPLRRDFAFIRCMNIVHSGYFSDRRIITALGHIADSLIDGGILLIGRTMRDGANNATFFRKSGLGFSILTTINDGYECFELLIRRPI